MNLESRKCQRQIDNNFFAIKEYRYDEGDLSISKSRKEM